jgi:hypothetical protein
MKNPLNCPFVPSFLAVVGATLLGQALKKSSTSQGSQDRGQKIDPRTLRAALDFWNSNKNLTWNEVASAFGFPSEASVINAVRRYAKKHGLKVRLISTTADEAKRQQALALSQSGVSGKQIAERLGYSGPTSAKNAAEAARRARRLDELYGREKNPLRRR